MGKTDSQGTPDRCEFYTVGRDDILGVTSQRDAPPVLNGSRDVFKSFMLHSHGVVEHLYTYLEFHLQLPPGTFSSKNRISFPSGTQTRLLKFSPQPSDDRRTSMVPHTDLGTITILFNILGGLQFLSPGLENSEKNWQFVRPEPGCAIINLGDAMVKWTNGLFKSPYHRVTYAPGEQANRVRYSVAYLVRPENETPMKRLQGSEMIPPLKEGEVEEDITAAEWHHKQSEKHRAK